MLADCTVELYYWSALRKTNLVYHTQKSGIYCHTIHINDTMSHFNTA